MKIKNVMTAASLVLIVENQPSENIFKYRFISLFAHFI